MGEPLGQAPLSFIYDDLPLLFFCIRLEYLPDHGEKNPGERVFPDGPLGCAVSADIHIYGTPQSVPADSGAHERRGRCHSAVKGRIHHNDRASIGRSIDFF